MSNNRNVFLFFLKNKLGRGTSTIDGCAIAYSTLKHLLVNVKCLVLFVTHYWRLTKVEEEFPDIAKNYHMAYIENPDREPGEPLITFLYKLVSGPSERSYGLNVAKLAGISEEIISKASIMYIFYFFQFNDSNFSNLQLI